MTPQELRDWRKDLGLEQGEAAELLGVSIRALSDMENGKSTISDRTALATSELWRRLVSVNGKAGAPLLYVVRFTDASFQHEQRSYFVIAKNGDEAAKLARAEAGNHATPYIGFEVIAHAPAGATSRVVTTLAAFCAEPDR